MSIVKRIRDLVRMFLSMFVDSAESSVPLERRLAYDRSKRAASVKKQIEAAEDVGAAAEMMVQQLAEARVMAANLRSEAKAHLGAAAAATARGDDVTRQQEENLAASLAEELADAEGEVAGLEQLVEESLVDKRESINMVLEQSRELETMARGDSRMVAKVRMTEMRRQQLELREQMMDLVPGDQDNLRARIQEGANKADAKYKARRDVVDAMWQQKKGATSDRSLTTSAAGRAKLDELKAEVGYATTVPSVAVTQPSVPVAQEAEAPPSEAAAGSSDNAP